MESFVNALYYIFPFIILLGILVFVHEFGHFLVARLCKVRVTDFSLGFGKELWKFEDKHHTKWKICAIPLGGYCQFLGDANGASAGSDNEAVAQLSEEDKKEAFAFQSPWKKLAIVLAGPGFNYLFAILLLTFMFAFWGKITYSPIVGEVMSDSAAMEAGIQAGDRILSINKHGIKDFSDISTEIALVVDGKADIVLLRDKEVMKLKVDLKTIEDENGRSHPFLGIKSKSSIELDHRRMSLNRAFEISCYETWKVTVGTLRGVQQMITRKRGTEDLGGVLRIAEMSGDISKKSGLLDFLAFMALLSINLGLINLFPIPVLDGGHVVIFLTEIVIRRPVSEKIKEFLFKCGFALLLALMIFATWNDVVHLFKRWFS